MPRLTSPLAAALAGLSLVIALSLCGTAPAVAATTRGGRVVGHGARVSGRRHDPAPVPAVPAVCPSADASPGTVSPRALNAAVVCITNQVRAKFDLPAFTENSLLDSSAQSWSDTMVAAGSFTHGTDFSQRITNAGYNWSTVGENIATGYATPADVVSAWMASPGHCRNILNPAFADIGIGVNAAPVEPVVTAGSTWTQDFGLTLTARVPSRNAGPMNGCPYVS